MKGLWLTLVSAVMATAAGVAVAGSLGGDRLVTAVPAAAIDVSGFRMVDRDGGDHWHGHRDWDRGDDWGGRVHTHIFFGFGSPWGPAWGPYWGPPSYYYNPPVVITQPPPPTVYISPKQRRKPYYWYYCESAKRYYPYVKQCPGGWLKVVPHAPRD
ncbi:MAG: hypothetical protein P8180_18050 [Gammaproteobacteria bacterium]